MTKTNRCLRLTIAALAAASLGQARAYETPVHADMTLSAFTRSVRDRDFLKDLGIGYVFDDQRNLLTLPILGNGVTGWAMTGAVAEDDLPRSLFHFYDPLANVGLFGVFQTAPDWAFSTSLNATYSLPGTRDSLYNALTNTDTIVRPKQWRDTFRGVGQFTHLLQDMAQPQHVRNDDHFSLTEHFYYLFPDYSRYEKRTLSLDQDKLLSFEGYPSVTLPDYRSYWNTADNRGLAQQTNLNFVSAKTNLDTGRYASPSGGTLLDEEVIPTVTDVFGNVVETNVTVQYVSYSYTDTYTNAPVTNNRLSAFSLFDFQRMQYASRHAYTLNNANHDRYAQILVPQAVGYSAGLIDRFFRGSLAISAPDGNVYGIVDHAKIRQTDPLGGFVGFDKIKLKVRNATANGEALTGGRLVAVAKFHRNGCYRDDLSGEFDSSFAPPCASYRTDAEEIVVSDPYPNESLGTAPTPYTFTFRQQIPINATDLQIQVVYRGAMGAEPDEVAVGTVDVFEPTYVSIYNSTDQILFNGVWTDTTSPALLPTLDTSPQDGVIDARWDRTDLDVKFNFDATSAAVLGEVGVLPPASYSRVAVITDQAPFVLQTGAQGVSFVSGGVNDMTPEINQVDLARRSYEVAPFHQLRGVRQWDTLTFYRYYGTPIYGDLSQLPAIRNTSPVPLSSLSF